MGENGLSVADALALQNQTTDGAFGGQGSWVFFLFFLLALGGNGFGGLGGNAGAVSNQINNDFIYTNLRADISNGFTQVVNGIQGVNQGICNLGYTQLSNFKDMTAQMADCCCGINRNIDALRSENYQNTCRIVDAVKSEGEATRALITANTIQELRDKNTSLQFENQNLNNSIINTAQTQTLVGTLRPYPQPAYITCSPYTTATNAAQTGTCARTA